MCDLIDLTFDIEKSDFKRHEEGQSIAACDSDYLLLFRKQSTLPIENSGEGVFAKADIPANTIICEYRGPLINSKDSPRVKGNDKLFAVTGVDGEKYEILGENVCAYINDCSAVLKRPYAIEEFVEFSKDTSDKDPGIACFDGYSYNAMAVSNNGKMFVAANRIINAGEEIFYPYSWGYWKNRLKLDIHDIPDKVYTIPELAEKFGRREDGSVLIPDF